MVPLSLSLSSGNNNECKRKVASWKSDLWMPRRAQKEGLPTKPGNLNYTLPSKCKNVIGHYSQSIESYLSMTHHKLKSLNLQCLTSCSNLVSPPKIYVFKLEQIEVVKSLLAGHDILSNLPRGFGESLICQVFCFTELDKNVNGSVT